MTSSRAPGPPATSRSAPARNSPTRALAKGLEQVDDEYQGTVVPANTNDLVLEDKLNDMELNDDNELLTKRMAGSSRLHQLLTLTSGI